MADEERALVPAGLVPGQIERGFAKAHLAVIRESSDASWLWTSARAAAIYAQVWAGHAEKRDEMEATQLLCEIQLGQVLGKNPGAGPGRGHKGPHGDVLPKQIVSDLRHFCGYANRLNEAVLGSLEHGRRVISRRGLLALAEGFRQPAEDETVELPAVGECFVRRGDFREALADLDGTVDAIITDPPYGRGALPLYADLSRFAARALRPGGSALVMVGQAYLPDVMAALGSALLYRWTLAYMTTGAHIQIWPPRILNGWKPVLWLTNGDSAGAWRYDVVQSAAPSKTFHGWGQSESGTDVLVERFTAAGDLICDPFVGGGTTGVMAVRRARRFVGAELDPDYAAQAERRIAREVMCESAREDGHQGPDLLEMASRGLDGALYRTGGGASTDDDRH